MGGVATAAGEPSAEQDEARRIGERCAALLPRDPSVFRRHVERFDIVSADVIRRSLTVDVQLPGAETAVAVSRSGEHHYYIPLAMMDKSAPVGNIDLRDEHGRSLPLHNESDRVAITRCAVPHVAADVLGGAASEGLESLLDQIVTGDAPARDAALGVVRALIAHQRKDAFGDAKERSLAFEGLLCELAFNTVIWLELSGRPGERRIVKFSYDAHRFERGYGKGPERPPKPLITGMHVSLPDAGIEQEVEPYVQPGAGNPRTPNYYWRWVTRRLGLMATDIVLYDLYTSGCETYHLDVAPPSGLDVLELRWRPMPDEDGRPKDLDDADIAPWSRERAQMQMPGTLPGFVSDALLTVRPGPLGVLSRAAAATSIAALLLWFYNADLKQVLEAGHRGEEPGALFLVAVSSLLAFAVVPRTEHPVASAVLYGMRWLALLAAGFAVVAAAAIFNVTLGGMDQHRIFHWCAVGATMIGLFASLAWALSFRGIWSTTRLIRERWRRDLWYVVFGASATLVAAAVVAAGAAWPEAINGLMALFFAVLVVLMALQAFAAGHSHEVDRREMVAERWLIGFGGLLTFVAAFHLALNLVDSNLSWDWRDAWPWLRWPLGIVELLALVWPVVRGPDGFWPATPPSASDARRRRRLFERRRRGDPLSDQRRERAHAVHLPGSADVSVLSAQAEPYIAEEITEAATAICRALATKADDGEGPIDWSLVKKVQIRWVQDSGERAGQKQVVAIG